MKKTELKPDTLYIRIVHPKTKKVVGANIDLKADDALEKAAHIVAETISVYRTLT